MAGSTRFPVVPAAPQRLTVLGLFTQACWVAAGAMLIWGFVMQVRGGPGGPVFVALTTCAKAGLYFERLGKGAAGPRSNFRSLGLLVLTALSFTIAAMALGAAA